LFEDVQGPPGDLTSDIEPSLQCGLMPAHRESAGLPIINIPVVALVLLIFGDFGSNFAMGQTTGSAPIFRPALEQIQSQTRIPILLPSRLPSAIPESGIKLASGEVRKDGYFISLYYSEDATASYAAGFGGSTRILTSQDLPNTRRVALSGGRTGMFRPVSCGGSCAPANLWWEQNGVMYQIQIKLGSGSLEKDQEKILVETANSIVTARQEAR
jgi:hypothetical protein